MTQKKQITKRTFICNILPSDYIIKSKASQAAINFCNRLMRMENVLMILDLLHLSAINYLPR